MNPLNSLTRLLLLLCLTWATLGQAWAGDNNSVMIDVRSPEEFAQGHIDGALNMPYDQIGDLIKTLELDKDTPVGLYCRSGRRAGIAQQTLEQMGFTRVENLGGYEDVLARQPQPDCTAEAC